MWTIVDCLTIEWWNYSVYKTNNLNILNLHNVICKIYLNKAGKYLKTKKLWSYSKYIINWKTMALF